MTQMKKQEIQDLPLRYRPLTAWGYVGYMLLFSIPLVGFISLIVCALSCENINRRSFARSYFCIYLIVIVLFVILAATGVASGFLDSILKALK
ncbi:MAG: ABC transporter permease [Christensenellaceae bacterium]